MPEAWGKLSKGQTAKLELSEDKISVSVQRGLIGRKMTPYKEIPLGDVNNVELYEGSHSSPPRRTRSERSTASSARTSPGGRSSYGDRS